MQERKPCVALLLSTMDYAAALGIRTMQSRLFRFFMAGKTELFFGGDQFDIGRVFLDLHLVTGGAPHGNRGVNMSSFASVFMALQAFRAIRIFFQRHRMLATEHATG